MLVDETGPQKLVMAVTFDGQRKVGEAVGQKRQPRGSEELADGFNGGPKYDAAGQI